ncbi:hypothetical protein QFC19_001708 [Naganishia cerealis]|uniref:Uncharacterized protein n=1 Tax=Naganishia cerealis TaxID=610337 RepID=A0ACC2WEW8_9TREE|nr:hypothetical protein QFC19_001708 [Naganishia cerealis]
MTATTTVYPSATVVPSMNSWCLSVTAAAATPAISESSTTSGGHMSTPPLANLAIATSTLAISGEPSSTSTVTVYYTTHRKHRRPKSFGSIGGYPHGSHANDRSSAQSPSSEEDHAVGHSSELAPRLEPSSQCVSWAMETYWMKLQPTSTETVIDVTSTSTGIATTHFWVPSVTAQNCAETPSMSSQAVVSELKLQWKLNPTISSAIDATTTSTGFLATISTTSALVAALGAAPTSSLNLYATSEKFHSEVTTHALAQPHLQTAVETTTSDSLAASFASPMPTGGAQHVNLPASAGQSNNVPSMNERASSKIAWACSAIGTVILIGILGWIVFERRKRNRKLQSYREEAEVLGEKRFYDDWHDEDTGGSEFLDPQATFRQIALDTNSACMENRGTNKVRNLFQ